MKAARSKPRRRRALYPSAERLHTQLGKLEELQGLRDRRTLIYMPQSLESQPVEGEGLGRGDLILFFEPLFDTDHEAGMSVETYVERTCRRVDVAPATLPWKRTATAVDPPVRSRDPELEELAEGLQQPDVDIRPLSGAELHEAARGLFATGHGFDRGVVRNTLAGGGLPLTEADEEYPKAEFASSTTGTLLIRVWNHRGEQPKPRPAMDADREQWPTTFQRFIDLCLARHAEAEHPEDEGDTR